MHSRTSLEAIEGNWRKTLSKHTNFCSTYSESDINYCVDRQHICKFRKNTAVIAIS